MFTTMLTFLLLRRELLITVRHTWSPLSSSLELPLLFSLPNISTSYKKIKSSFVHSINHYYTNPSLITVSEIIISKILPQLQRPNIQQQIKLDPRRNYALKSFYFQYPMKNQTLFQRRLKSQTFAQTLFKRKLISLLIFIKHQYTNFMSLTSITQT